jgi:uncharacterized phage protein (TIGR01671 family)
MYKLFTKQTFDAILMQYTGLKDKNGVEIYEGDVVEAKGYYQDKYIIEWVYDGWEIFDGKDGVVADFDEWEKLEVIGNIYENPELLEDK